MEHLKQDAAALAEYLVGMRRQLHMHPEICFEEYAAAALIEAELDKLGIPHERLGPTGVYAVLKGGAGEGRCVLLRADMDALPMTETAEVPYRSQNPGRMHACGHDAHVACLLGAARLLKDRLAELAGEVRLVFQPAEEVGGGTGPFLAAGVLDGVYRSFGLHCAPDVPCGTVGLKPGLNNASVDHFTVRIHGRAAHAGLCPEEGRNAVAAAARATLDLLDLPLRSPGFSRVNVGTFRGGSGRNVIPAEAEITVETRGETTEVNREVEAAAVRLCEAAAQAYGCTCQVRIMGAAGTAVCNPALAAQAAEILERVEGVREVLPEVTLTIGEDITTIMERVQQRGGQATELIFAMPLTASHHNGRFDVDEAVIGLAVRAITELAMNIY
jgi:amidohydrolase